MYLIHVMRLIEKAFNRDRIHFDNMKVQFENFMHSFSIVSRLKYVNSDIINKIYRIIQVNNF